MFSWLIFIAMKQDFVTNNVIKQWTNEQHAPASSTVGAIIQYKSSNDGKKNRSTIKHKRIQGKNGDESHPQGLGARPAFRAWMVATSVLKALARMLSSMLVVKRVVGSDTVPALALPKAEIAKAGFWASALYWKWTSPLGTMNMSPACRVWVKNLLVVSTNPTWREPSTRKRSSADRGWVWGGLVVPAIAILATTNEATSSDRNLKVEEADAMMKNLMWRSR